MIHLGTAPISVSAFYRITSVTCVRRQTRSSILLLIADSSVQVSAGPWWCVYTRHGPNHLPVEWQWSKCLRKTKGESCL